MSAALTDKMISFAFFRLLFAPHVTADHFIHFRCIANLEPRNDPQGKIITETKNVLSLTVSFRGFREAYCKEGGIFDQLTALNLNPTLPANVYYALAARLNDDKKMDKKSCLGFTSFYLDLDVNAQWTLQDRMLQVNYWRTLGIGPSILVASGTGLQAIWLLNRVVPTEIGEKLLQRMVSLAGCKGGGNCWDVSRIFRTPGFLNQKEWFKGLSRPAVLLYPEPEVLKAAINSEDVTKSGATYYEPELFQAFPPSSVAVIHKVVNEAKKLPGDYSANLKQLAQTIAAHQQEHAIEGATSTVLTAGQKDELKAGKASKGFAPMFDAIPDNLDDIPIPVKTMSWFRIYCLRGFNGLSNKELLKISEKTNLSGEVSASELDAKVMYALIKTRYSFAAIEKFWRRPDLKLWRDDKMERSPDYLEKTYQNMFALVTQAMEQKAQLNNLGEIALPVNTVFVDGKGCTLISRGMQKAPALLLNATVEIAERLIDMDEPDPEKREWYKLNVLDFQKKPASWIITRTAFNSAREFRRNCRHDVLCFTSSDNDIAFCHRHWLEKSYPRMIDGTFHSAIAYDKAKHAFIFPTFISFANHLDFNANLASLEAMRARIPICGYWIKEAKSREECAEILKHVWPHILRLHSPRLLLTTLGSLAATAMREIFAAHGFPRVNVPCLNIQGTSCSGKTETLRCIYRLTGCQDAAAATQSVLSTYFALSQLLNMYRSIPLFLDEFKQETGDFQDMRLLRHLQDIRELIRRMYSGETLSKGRADLSIKQDRQNATLWVAGETGVDRAGHLSETTRLLTVQTDDWNTNLSRSAFDTVRETPIEYLAPYFYQYLLTLNPKEEYQTYSAICAKFAQELHSHLGRIGTRISNNLAITAYGVRIWDRFLDSWKMFDRLPSLNLYLRPSKHLIETTIEQAMSSGSLLATKHQGVTLVRETDEATVFLGILGKMVLTHDKEIIDLDNRQCPCYTANDATDTLYIDLQTAYSAYRLYCLRHRYSILEQNVIRQRIQGAAERGEPWVISTQVDYSLGDGVQKTAVALRLSLMRSMRLWPSTTLLAAPGLVS